VRADVAGDSERQRFTRLEPLRFPVVSEGGISAAISSAPVSRVTSVDVPSFKKAVAVCGLTMSDDSLILDAP
jgi:hypothetical protein